MSISERAVSLDPTDVPRRTVLKAAAWSAPVIAVAVATPLAAASTALAALTIEATPIIDVEAPYGARSLRVANTSTADYSGPLTIQTSAWTTVAPFSIPRAVEGTAGGNLVWTLASVTIPAGQSLQLNLAWTGPNPITAETQPFTAAVDPARGSITPAGNANIVSPYAYLWAAVVPGGQGKTTGSPAFFIGNTTETPLNTTVTARLSPPWSFPLQQVAPVVVDGTQYNGFRAAENGVFVGVYSNVPVNPEARTGRENFTFNWFVPTGPQSYAQQTRALASIITAGGVMLPTLGSTAVYSIYRP